MQTPIACWDNWVGEALETLYSLRPICLRNSQPREFGADDGAFQVFDEMQQRDRSSVEVEIAETTFSRWMHDTPVLTLVTPEARVIHQSIIEVTSKIK
ncbi:8-amino-7-oxononanoate synthase [Glycine max]|nr:8-amino-7-oxononanoate synthase [Glycine max]